MYDKVYFFFRRVTFLLLNPPKNGPFKRLTITSMHAFKKKGQTSVIILKCFLCHNCYLLSLTCIEPKWLGSLWSAKAVLTVGGLLMSSVTASNSEGRKAVILNASKGFVLFSSCSSRTAWYPLALGRASWVHYTLRHNMLAARISLTEKWSNSLRQSFDPGWRRLQLFSMDNAFSQNGTLNNVDRSSGLLKFLYLWLGWGM